MISKKDYILKNLTERSLKQSELSQIFNVSIGEISKLKKTYKEELNKIQEVRNKFRKKKYSKNKEINLEFKFIDFKEFYDWYTEQPRYCSYCGIEEKKLQDLYDNEILISKRGSKRGRSLEIERRNSTNNDYSKDNCVLACYFCNNHKSDIITEADHREYFSENIKKYLLDKWFEISR